MNLKKKFVVGVASVAMLTTMGIAPASAVDNVSFPGFIGGTARLAGADRVQTSLAVADHEYGHRSKASTDKDRERMTAPATRLYIASADNAHMVDAATAGMLVDGPIVFVSNSVYVGTAVGKHFADTKANPAYKAIKEVVPIGGTAAVADSVAKAVSDEITGSKVGTRLAGDDRYATSVAIADYIYQKGLENKENGYWGRVTTKGNLRTMYFANGADNHVVDSMVSGTLDNGAVLLSNPDGKIPEVVAEFIKKTLPETFAALGGTAAVPDSTVQDAWVIKALANKWDTSYVIPDLDKSAKDLDWEINGGATMKSYNPEPTMDMRDVEHFGGLVWAKGQATGNASLWAQEVNSIKNDIRKWTVTAKKQNFTAAEAVTNITGLLQKIYGTKVIPSDINAAQMAEFLVPGDTDNMYADVDYAAIQNSDAYKALLKDATDDLTQLWKSTKQDQVLGKKLSNKIALASQDNPSAKVKTSQDDPAVYSNVPLKAVQDAADFTVKVISDWLTADQALLAQLQGQLRAEVDKIAPKTELRLGGADRYETAQLIAHQWAKRYASEYNSDGIPLSDDWRFYEAYVASGNRLPDSLTAGQLTAGPIMLVKGNEKSSAELPEFTHKVATNLQCWSDRRHSINLYGIGGDAVLADSVLKAVVADVNTGSKCKAEIPADKAPKTNMLTADEVYTTAGATAAVDTNARIVGKSAVPTGLVIDSILNSVGADVYTDDSSPAAGKIYAAPATGAKNPISVKAGASVAAGIYTVKFHDADGLKGEFIVHIAAVSFACTAITNAKLDDENAITGGTKPYAILSVTPLAKGKASDVTIVDSSKLKIAWTGAVDTYNVMLLDKAGNLGTCAITTVDPTLAVAAPSSSLGAGNSTTVAASYTNTNVIAAHAKPVITKVEVTPQAGATAGKLTAAVNSLDSSKIDIASAADATTGKKYDVKVTDNRGETKTITVTI